MAFHQPPIGLVRYLAKAGFITRSLWREFFFTGGAIRWEQMCWQELKRRKYCDLHAEKRFRDIYILNRANRAVRDLVPGPLVTPPWSANIEHDETLFRGILIGSKSGLIQEWKSEAELKAEGRNAFRIVSTTGKVKYPDLLVYPVSESIPKPVAIECELTQKSAKRYDAIMSAYGGMSEIANILFVTDSPAIRAAVTRSSKENHYPLKERPIFFIGVERWRTAADAVLREHFAQASAHEELKIAETA